MKRARSHSPFPSKKQKLQLVQQMKCSGIFSPQEVDEIFNGVEFDEHRFGGFGMTNSLKPLQFVIEDRSRNHFRAGFKFLRFRGVHVFRLKKPKKVICHPLTDLSVRNRWLSDHGFSLEPILPVCNRLQNYPTLDNSPLVHWVNPESQVVITGFYRSFGHGSYSSICGPVAATQKILQNLLRDSQDIKDIACYFNDLSEDLDPEEHQTLMQKVKSQMIHTYIGENPFFDAETCEEDY